ncbi:SAM-dependent methyltransferase [Natronorubrum sp. DTA28]|uniref:SAM-dependent methyltransferase n=1 Tax=Natronorubrum sp. DTA28 TaxID=3447019 RepID=UPI003F84EE92
MAHWTDELYGEQSNLFEPILEIHGERAASDVEAVLGLLEAEGSDFPERVLDIGCGIGSHAIAFAERGLVSEGLDLSAEYVNRARREARSKGIEDRVEFHHHDMRALDEWQGSYDLVTSMWDSFGYYGKERDTRILSEIERLVSDRGAVVMDLSNKPFLLSNFTESAVGQFSDRMHVKQMTYDVETSRLESSVLVFSKRKGEYEYVDTMELRRRLYDPVELTELFEDAGFEDVSLFGGLNGDPLERHSHRVVVLAT